MTLGSLGSMAPPGGVSALPVGVSGAGAYCQGGEEFGSLAGIQGPGKAHLVTVTRWAGPRGRSSSPQMKMRAPRGRRIWIRFHMRPARGRILPSGHDAPPSLGLKGGVCARGAMQSINRFNERDALGESLTGLAGMESGRPRPTRKVSLRAGGVRYTTETNFPKPKEEKHLRSEVRFISPPGTGPALLRTIRQGSNRAVPGERNDQGRGRGGEGGPPDGPPGNWSLYLQQGCGRTRIRPGAIFAQQFGEKSEKNQARAFSRLAASCSTSGGLPGW
jgi:hypothetical protein